MKRSLHRLTIFLPLLAVSTFVLESCSDPTSNQTSGKERLISENDKLESKGWDMLMKQRVLMTKDPALGYVPTERAEAAYRYMNNQFAAGRIDALAWTERGPNNIGGRTRTIVVDKRDNTGNTIFSAGVGGGIWKCTNFKSSPVWTKINDFMSNLAVTTLVQDPVNNNTFYAGTGEGWFNIDAIRGGGIFKSTDGGVTWNLLASTSGFEYVQDMAIDNSGNVYASLRNSTSAFRGVMRSNNGGTSWTQVLGAPLAGFSTGRATDLEVASNGEVWACLGIFGTGSIWKCPNDGANTGIEGSWNNLTPIFPSTTAQRIEVAVSPSNPQRAYAFAQNASNSQVTAVMKTDNGGITWTSVAVPSALNNGANSQTWYNLIAAVDPNDPEIVFAGGLNLARSTNGGTSWSTVSTSGTVHVDQHALVYDGSSNLMVGNDGGIYYSSNPGAATPAFSSRNTGFNITQYYGCAIHPTNANYFLCGSQDNGTHKFLSAGVNTVTTEVGGDGMLSHIDQTDGQIQIASNFGNNYWYSNTGGSGFNFVSAGANGRFINPSDYDDAGNILYTCDTANKYNFISNFTGTAFNTRVTVSGMSGRQISAIKVDPNAANTIWIAGATDDNSGTGVVPVLLKLTSANTASPTVAVNTTLSFLPAGAYISSIDVERNFANNILITCSNFGVTSVFQSIDGGSTFTAIEGNLPDMPVYAGMYAPRNAQLNGTGGGNGGIILGTEFGVWTTSNINGASTVWLANNSGFANVQVLWLEYRASDGLVAAATHGRGLFTSILPFATGVGNLVNTKNFISYISSASGNSLLIATGNLATTRSMDIRIFDMNGRLVLSRSGPYQNINIDISKLPAASYTLRITGNRKENYTGQFVK